MSHLNVVKSPPTFVCLAATVMTAKKPLTFNSRNADSCPWCQKGHPQTDTICGRCFTANCAGGNTWTLIQINQCQSPDCGRRSSVDGRQLLI